MEAGGMKPGDVFYMQAGASGVGLAAIQFAKQMGAEVITTIDSPEKAEFVRKLGADYVLDYRSEDVRPVIEAHPPTVALDCIGGEWMGECFRHMVFGGRWIMIATMGGAETTINLETVWRKRIRLIGSTLRSRTPEEKSTILQALQQKLWPLFTARKLITNIHAVFPLTEAQQAHDVLRRCENIGKVVLTVP
jgi:NADPH2:quinone reductase